MAAAALSGLSPAGASAPVDSALAAEAPALPPQPATDTNAWWLRVRASLATTGATRVQGDTRHISVVVVPEQDAHLQIAAATEHVALSSLVVTTVDGLVHRRAASALVPCVATRPCTFDFPDRIATVEATAREVVPVVRLKTGMRHYSYAICVRGAVRVDPLVFAAHVARVYADARGWSRAGVQLIRAKPRIYAWASCPRTTSFDVVLTQAQLVPRFGPPCDATYSCRAGRYVAINEARFTHGVRYWPLGLTAYRTMVINHETGHWLGLHHRYRCVSGKAPVMMQQSIFFMHGTQARGCSANSWPTTPEVRSVRAHT